MAFDDLAGNQTTVRFNQQGYRVRPGGLVERHAYMRYGSMIVPITPAIERILRHQKVLSAIWKLAWAELLLLQDYELDYLCALPSEAKSRRMAMQRTDESEGQAQRGITSHSDESEYSEPTERSAMNDKHPEGVDHPHTHVGTREEFVWTEIGYLVSRLNILWIYLLTCLLKGPGAAYALWRRSHLREQRFRAIYGRLYTYKEVKPIIDKQLWYKQVLHRDPTEEELDQIIEETMTWRHSSGGGCNSGSADSPRD